MGGEDDWLAEPSQPRDDPAQPLGTRVRLAMDGGEEVAAGLDAESRERVRALSRDRREAEARVGHDVADNDGLPFDSLSGKACARAVVGAEE